MSIKTASASLEDQHRVRVRRYVIGMSSRTLAFLLSAMVYRLTTGTPPAEWVTIRGGGGGCTVASTGNRSRGARSRIFPGTRTGNRPRPPAVPPRAGSGLSGRGTKRTGRTPQHGRRLRWRGPTGAAGHRWRGRSPGARPPRCGRRSVRRNARAGSHRRRR
ncbi:DUF3099 domain-containing protein [Rhodococcus opacus]